MSNVFDAENLDHGVIIIGAGVSGIYQLYRLREAGIDATVIEAGSGPGGTWYWNRYPGARFDSESYSYGYSFSKELLQEWSWSEHFAGQPETHEYLNYVVDKFDLRRDMQFNCRVSAARFDEAGNRWVVCLEDGRELTCRILLTAIGMLSAATMPRIDGVEDFEGEAFHTYYWPQEPLDLAGKRVAVIGTGATGVQVISEIADKVKSLTVYQRRPNWCAPLHNGAIDAETQAKIKASYDEIFARCRSTPGGFLHGPDPRSFDEVSPDDRRILWEELYASPGFGVWISNFREVLMQEEPNAEYSAFIAEKIRQRVTDPVIAEKLIPRDHGFGTRRVPLETRYYEAYNRANVELVDITETPIERVTKRGIKTSDGEKPFDLIVYATGFDAITGAFDRIDITGIGGRRLRDKWRDGPITYLGLQVSEFPNMLILAGPQGGSVSTNFPRGIEEAVDWLTDLIIHMRDTHSDRVEPHPEAEQQWGEHVKDAYKYSLFQTAKSWFTGYNSNVPGHDRMRYLIYNGGSPRYRKWLADVAGDGYRGFDLGG